MGNDSVIEEMLKAMEVRHLVLNSVQNSPSEQARTATGIGPLLAEIVHFAS